ncbi:MAG: hypothetical protein JRD68_16730 [Deltaproteobacteria bacterium]|nr:hypothetical protein [Deltaproteobacteria bacterium]
MLDKQIHAHLDKQDKLEIAVEDDIDALLKVVSIKKLIDNPEEVLLAIMAEVGDTIKNEYAKEAIENGIEFAKGVKKTNEDIKIQRTKDPHLNKDDVTGKDNRQD